MNAKLTKAKAFDQILAVIIAGEDDISILGRNDTLNEIEDIIEPWVGRADDGRIVKKGCPEDETR